MRGPRCQEPARPEVEEFTRAEREALALWRAPEPPAGFSERVLARARADRASVSPVRGLAVAALALVVLAGMVSVHALSGAGGATAPRPEWQVVESPGRDAGPGPEVRAPLDRLDPPPS